MGSNTRRGGGPCCSYLRSGTLDWTVLPNWMGDWMANHDHDLLGRGVRIFCGRRRSPPVSSIAKRFVLGHWNKSTLDDYVSIDAAEFVKFDSKVDGKTIPATLLMRDNTGRKLLILEVTDPAEVKKVHDLTER